MKEIQIAENLTQKIDAVQLGVLQAVVKVDDSPKEFIALLEQEAKKIRESKQLEDIAKIPTIMSTREAYKALGKKPARYRVSSEALHRRIIQGKGLYFINNVVDINNLVSIRSGYGICLYDLDKITGDIAFRIAQSGETYQGIGKYELNLENLPVFSDDVGPFGSPTSDSERTMITENTRRILFVIVAFTNKPIHNWLQMAGDLLKKYANGQSFEQKVILAGNPTEQL